ncbi:gliding motility-associated ABC transporter substrate-binding protein GldG [Lacihabitans soyangensis]|uniref:Gliding motility-associated ABC transporter substrate-binding protein GldG n=1 Tax=Lacihabitans soyangensis TaxID=869394 RepID=A0AAE3KXF4_9BACT|nr:gliding motility-associated ABC transporter substrate-binding protein GldG [Lacihabitans soyangensis]MCP9764875.1 gliding motility-associated ABC transporter substrate-binding protein GldG [Lacihabitans soyangensis]
MSKILKNNIILILSIIALNILGFWVYFRADLTADKRYSISESSKNLLKNLEDEVIIKVYLDGEGLPGGFERLKRAVKETLVEFKYFGKDNIDYQFINPYNGSEDERNKLFKELVEKGMQPTNIFAKEDGKKVENLVFPYATIWYQNKEVPVLLLKANLAQDSQTKLNQSYENVEYELASAIQKLTNTKKKKIGLLSEFTNLQPINFAGLINTLQEYYDLYIIDSKKSPSFAGLDALIVPKPDKPVDDSTKAKIDQYIMNGGRVLFFVDGLKVDSVGLEGSFAQPLDVNLDDMLFKYGVRINKNIVKDGLNAAIIPMVVGNMGDKPNIQPMPYRYFPLINKFSNSLITKNIDMVYTKFTASIDPVNGNDGLKKTPLLLTSQYTKVLNAPALITYNEARTDTDETEYQGGVKTVAYLIEGTFKSILQKSFTNSEIKTTSVPTKILVCSDGDIIVNEIDRKTGNPYPMGFDRFSQHQYGNQDFVINTLNYLLDEQGLLTAKSKSVGLRPLDKLKVNNQKTKWQLINIVLPLVLLVVFGFLRFYYVKNKYAQA